MHLAAAGVWLLAGCSLVVGGDPTIVCKNDEGCPSDSRCAKGTGTCIANANACTDTSCGATQRCDESTLTCVDVEATEPDAEAEPDASEADADSGRRSDGEAGPPVVRIGDRCTSQAGCARILADKDTVPGICASEPLTGFDTPSFCTKHCCETSDCPSQYFCEHGPNAGRYCVPFGADTRAAPTGTKLGGASCTSHAECITGNCDAADPAVPAVKTCIDTCCNDGDCEAGLVCGLRDGDTLQWICRTALPGGGNANADCSITGPEGCKSGACYGGADAFCTASCCSNASCTTLGLNRCVSGSTEAGTSRVNICADAAGSLFAPGATCASDSQCASNICAGLKCAATCCTNTDCGGDTPCIADGVEPRPHCAAN